MAALAFTPAKIRALTENGALVRPYRAGAALEIGQAVFIASDGDVEPADANVSAGAARAIGIVVQSYDGEVDINAGDPASVCVFGPVAGFEDLTPGTNGYITDTAGELGDAEGAYGRVMGYAESARIFFVLPEMNDPAS